MNDIQNTFLRRVLKVGKSCPIALMHFDLGQLLMMNRVLQRKLMFLHHVSHLENNALSCLFYEKQRDIPMKDTLVTDLQEDLFHMNTTLLEMEDMKKAEWKSMVKKYVTKKNKESLRVNSHMKI